jgi:hypothetical protein
MTIKGSIEGQGKKYCADVTKWGQLVVAPLDFSKFYDATAGVDDVPVEIVPAESGKQFIITGLLIYGNRLIGVNDATVRIYEADGPAEVFNSSTDQTIFLQEVAKNQTISLFPLNVVVNPGKWINGVTNDDDVFFNISGYYVTAC